jgi:CheY-like chemotaxis protein
MPVMDGIEATRKIRALENGKTVKIIAVTASAFNDERDMILNTGMDDFIRKPYRVSEIFECLEKHLGIRFTYGELRTTEPISESSIKSEELCCLPVKLRDELIEGLILGETDKLIEIVNKIKPQYPEIAQNLQTHIEAFDYLTLLNALEKIK